MRRDVFPDPATFDYPAYVRIGEEYYAAPGVVSFGTPLTPANAREAYSKGIFPWPTEDLPLPWHCPGERAILEFDKLRIPRSLAKVRRNSTFTFTIDKEFGSVINECRLAFRPGQYMTWITQKYIDVFTKLHNDGLAHSVEVWEDTGRLIGGLYGIDAGGVFCGESMFFKRSNASKLAVLFLIDHLRARGATWLDNQVMTPHFAALGAEDIPRLEFLEKLRNTQRRKLSLFGPPEKLEQ